MRKTLITIALISIISTLFSSCSRKKINYACPASDINLMAEKSDVAHADIPSDNI